MSWARQHVAHVDNVFGLMAFFPDTTRTVLCITKKDIGRSTRQTTASKHDTGAQYIIYRHWLCSFDARLQATRLNEKCVALPAVCIKCALGGGPFDSDIATPEGTTQQTVRATHRSDTFSTISFFKHKFKASFVIAQLDHSSKSTPSMQRAKGLQCLIRSEHTSMAPIRPQSSGHL